MSQPPNSPAPRRRCPPEDVQRADILAHLLRAPDYARHQRFFSASQRKLLKEQMAPEGIVDRYPNEALRAGARCPVWVRLRLDAPVVQQLLGILRPCEPELARCKCGKVAKTQTELDDFFGTRPAPTQRDPQRRRVQAWCKACRGVHRLTSNTPNNPNQLDIFNPLVTP